MRIYYAHLDAYVGRHLSQASKTLSPYVSWIDAKIYRPYVWPVLEAFLPTLPFIPEPPKNFWSMIADKLPSMGSLVAENKASMSDFIAELNKSKRPADVPIPSAGKASMSRIEADRLREAIKERVNAQGKKGYESVRAEVN